MTSTTMTREFVLRYTSSSKVKACLSELRNLRKVWSDTSDGEHHYVDLVLEGGGVLGTALVGYTYALEEAGIRFASIAGTSAGAINAIVLAAAAPPGERRTPRVLEAVAQADFWSFVDGSAHARGLTQALLDGKNLALLWRGLLVVPHLRKHLGLNPGHAFETWLRNLLTEWGIDSTEKLLERMNRAPAALSGRFGARLALIAADLTTESKVRFPDMEELYFPRGGVHPAAFVRASMSIPLFFHPYRVGPVSTRPDLWEKHVKYRGRPLPREVLFVDGGILANFPIDTFHVRERAPERPTLGVKLGVDRNKPGEIGTLKELALAAFKSTSHILDFDFLVRNPDYEKLVASIPTEGYNWLDFSMSEEDKIGLFERGVETALAFLKEFDWQAYKKYRQDLLTATHPATLVPQSQSMPVAPAKRVISQS